MTAGADAPHTGPIVVPDLPPDVDGYTAASAYARGGMYVIPLRPRTKHPGSYLGKDWPSRSTRSGADIFNLWMEDHPAAGVGIHAGRSGLLVVDVDKPEKLPDVLRTAIVDLKPPFQITRVTGLDQAGEFLALDRGELRGHALFRVPPGRILGNSIGKLPPGWGEMRGTNGFVVTAPSVHEDAGQGGMYRWLRTGPVPYLSPDVADLLPDGAGTGESVASPEQVEAFHRTYGGELGRTGSARIRGLVKRFTERVDAGHGRHTEAVAVAVAMCREAVAGAYPARLALVELYREFERQVNTNRGARPERADLRAEFAGITAWAVGQAVGAPDERIDDVRTRLGLEGRPRPARGGTSGDTRATGGRAAPTVAVDQGALDLWSTAPLEAPETVEVQEPTDAPEGGTTPTPAGVEPPTDPWGPLVPVDTARVSDPDRQRVAVYEPPPAPPWEAGTDEPGGFWERRKVLRHIRQSAVAQYASPWAVLGVVLARVVAATWPHVVLPPTVGGVASLNLFVALTARSGGGKGAAEAVGQTCVEVDPRRSGSTTGFPTHALGSGEGLAHMFMKRPKPKVGKNATEAERDPEPYQYNTAALVTISEIDTFGALTARNGSTLGGQIRQAAMGEQLGFFYVDKDKRMQVPAHAYRLCLLAGVQPRRAAVLLDDADGGTPQRFLWLPATNPDAPDEADMPECPAPLLWTVPEWPVAQDGQIWMELPEAAREHTRALRREHLRGEGDPLDGHANLTRLKVAAALAILDGRPAVSDEDWELSATVMARSDATRAQVIASIDQERQENNAAQAHAEASRALVVNDRLDAAQRKRVAAFITRKLGEVTDPDGWISTRDLKSKLASRDKSAFGAVIDALIETGHVESEAIEYHGRPGVQYRLSRRPG